MKYPCKQVFKNIFALWNLTLFTPSAPACGHIVILFCGFVVKLAENGCVCKYTCDMCSGTLECV